MDITTSPEITIIPKTFLSAYRLWSSIPNYNLKSIALRKSFTIKQENLKSARCENSTWTFLINSDSHIEILVRAHQDEVIGGFEIMGPAPTLWRNLIQHYVVRSPVLLTLLISFFWIFLALKAGAHFQSQEYLAQYPNYSLYPKEFLKIINNRIVFWGLFVPLTLTPCFISTLGLIGLLKSNIGRIQAAIKVESVLLLITVLVLLLKFPLDLFRSNWKALSLPLDHPTLIENLKGKNQ